MSRTQIPLHSVSGGAGRPVLNGWLWHGRLLLWGLLGTEWQPAWVADRFDAHAIDALGDLRAAILAHRLHGAELGADVIEAAAAAVNACAPGIWPLERLDQDMPVRRAGLAVPAFWSLGRVGSIAWRQYGDAEDVDGAHRERLAQVTEAATRLQNVLAELIGKPYGTGCRLPRPAVIDLAWRAFDRRLAQLGNIIVLPIMTAPALPRPPAGPAGLRVVGSGDAA